jgi:hypothetical protein
VIATVLVLQALEGLSDRDALRALVTDLRWKVAAGLALDDEGFHPTVLTLWRNKLRASDAPERVFDAVREVVAQTGVLAAKTRRALDSTLLDDAVATQDTVTQLCSMIRRVRKQIPAAAAVALVGVDLEATGVVFNCQTPHVDVEATGVGVDGEAGDPDNWNGERNSRHRHRRRRSRRNRNGHRHAARGRRNGRNRARRTGKPQRP